jgi:hypothetical protein
MQQLFLMLSLATVQLRREEALLKQKPKQDCGISEKLQQVVMIGKSMRVCLLLHQTRSFQKLQTMSPFVTIVLFFLEVFWIESLLKCSIDEAPENIYQSTSLFLNQLSVVWNSITRDLLSVHLFSKILINNTLMVTEI